jgi:hypothetical protein
MNVCPIFTHPGFLVIFSTELDIFVDTTFSCCPTPFYQRLILMLFDHITSLYVPLLYVLMTHKNEALYWHAFNAIRAISEWKIKVRSYCSNFEVSLMKQLDIAFGKSFGGFHVGCFFHFKQALRKRLTDKLNMPKDLIKLAMLSGMLDPLCVIPCDKVEGKGIAYVCLQLEKGKDSRKEKKKWEEFWLYIQCQWIPLLDRWNICDKDGKYYDMVNRTNNGIESYNHRFNKLFPQKPPLITFVYGVEEESRFQAQTYDDVRTRKMREPTQRIEQKNPSIPATYNTFVFP